MIFLVPFLALGLCFAPPTSARPTTVSLFGAPQTVLVSPRNKPAAPASEAVEQTASASNTAFINIDAARAETPSSSPSSSSPPPPPYTPIVTPPPDQDAQLAKQGYTMTTYYTCNTIGGREHCGWHVPVLKADAGPPATKTDVGVVVAVVACLAGVFAWGLI